jgi:membrane protein
MDQILVPFSPLLPATMGLRIVAAVSVNRPARGIKPLEAQSVSGDNRALSGRPLGVGKPPAGDKSAAALIELAKKIFIRINNDNLMLVAAGVAFYAMTAIFPAIAAFVSIYGLFSDPIQVRDEVAGLSGLLPAASLKLLTDALQTYASKSRSSLNFALLASVAVALWSVRAGVTSLMTGLNIANEQTEKRSFVTQQIVAFALTFAAMAFAVVALAAVALVPAAIALFSLPESLATALDLGRWPVLAALLSTALAVTYRFGPYKEHPKWRWISWGAAIATVLWLISSALFSFYVSHFGSYDATYGSLAAPVVLLLWFWITALIILIGAVIDAELEHSDGAELALAPQRNP